MQICRVQICFFSHFRHFQSKPVRHFDRDPIKEWVRITIGTDEEMEALLKATEEIL